LPLESQILAVPENENNLVFYRQSSIKTVINEGANKLLRKTLDAIEIEHISIHSDIQTTLDYYSHVLKEMEERDEEIAINVYSS